MSRRSKAAKARARKRRNQNAKRRCVTCQNMVPRNRPSDMCRDCERRLKPDVLPPPVSEEAGGPCHFCEKDAGKDAFCFGCGVFICEECDATGATLLGHHLPDDHHNGSEE